MTTGEGESEEPVRRPTDPEPEPHRNQDLTDEGLDRISTGRIYRKELPHKERVRLTLMVVLGVVWGLMFFLNIGFALLLSDADYKDVGAAVGTGLSVVGGFLGAIFGYYLAGKD